MPPYCILAVGFKVQRIALVLEKLSKFPELMMKFGKLGDHRTFRAEADENTVSIKSTICTSENNILSHVEPYRYIIGTVEDHKSW